MTPQEYILDLANKYGIQLPSELLENLPAILSRLPPELIAKLPADMQPIKQNPIAEAPAGGMTMLPQIKPSIEKIPFGLKPEMEEGAKKLLELAAQEGINLRITEGLRPRTRQEELYAQGRTPGDNRPIVTHAVPGDSPHEYGSAIDIVPVENGKLQWNNPEIWNKIGQLVKRIGLVWGGDFPAGQKDLPHVQLPDWRKYKTAKRISVINKLAGI